LENRRLGATVVGVCGGYQMLGRWVRDPHGVESRRGEVRGLELLDVETVMEREKVTAQAEGVPREGTLPWITAGETLRGYEIHMGRTSLGSGARPLFRLRRLGAADWHDDGALSADGRVFGTYLHGLFDNDGFRRALLDAHREEAAEAGSTFEERKQEGYDRLADLLRRSLDLTAVRRILEEGPEL
jgi:adenosylcobyric acid synthase